MKNNFCVRHKNRRKHNQHFKVLFLTINLQVITSNQIFTYRKLNFPLTNQSTPHVLFATHKPLKVAAAKALLFRGVWLVQLASMNVFYSITFHKSLSFLWGNFNRHVVAFFEACVLKEVRILCVISTITVRC